MVKSASHGKMCKTEKKQTDSYIKVLRPKVYITDSASFKKLVQELTGYQGQPPPTQELHHQVNPKDIPCNDSAESDDQIFLSPLTAFTALQRPWPWLSAETNVFPCQEFGPWFAQIDPFAVSSDDSYLKHEHHSFSSNNRELCISDYEYAEKFNSLECIISGE